jgi:hypothetical protein
VRAAPYRPLNPFFRQRIEQGGKKKDSLRLIGGWPHYTTFHDIFKAGVCAHAVDRPTLGARGGCYRV